MPKVLTVDAKNPDPKAIKEAVKIVQRGGAIVYPTDTVYGIGANALDPEAVIKVFNIKNRPRDQAMPVAVSGIEMAEELVFVTVEARRLIERFWPGALTLILKKRPTLPAEVTGGSDRAGLRAPNHPVPLSIIRMAQLPITSTSANRHGLPSPLTVEEAVRQLGEGIDLVIDAGGATGGVPSTVLDLTSTVPAIIRKGPVSKEEIEATIGFVVADRASK